MNIYGLILVILKKLMKIINKRRFVVGDYKTIKEYSNYAEQKGHNPVIFSDLSENEQEYLYAFISEVKREFTEQDKPFFHLFDRSVNSNYGKFYVLLNDCVIEYNYYLNSKPFIRCNLAVFVPSVRFVTIYEL